VIYFPFKTWENFVFATLVFAHIGLAILSFDILLWPYSLPLRGKTKTGTTIKGAKAYHHFHFGFAPHERKMIHYQELAGQKQNVKN
jgi:hypothetical protein